jgi:hypothetical protein
VRSDKFGYDLRDLHGLHGHLRQVDPGQLDNSAAVVIVASRSDISWTSGSDIRVCFFASRSPPVRRSVSWSVSQSLSARRHVVTSSQILRGGLSVRRHAVARSLRGGASSSPSSHWGCANMVGGHHHFEVRGHRHYEVTKRSEVCPKFGVTVWMLPL